MERVLDIYKDKIYDEINLKDIDLDLPATGRHIWVGLRRSQTWIDLPTLARFLGCERSNITKNVIWNFSDRAVRYHEGKRVRYSFHRSIIREYVRKNP